MKKSQIFENLPAVNREAVRKCLAEEVRKSDVKLVVLDDDPTGVQTVHDVSVYTDWETESIEKGFEEKENLFFILTNSRALSAADTVRVHTEIAERTAEISRKKGPFIFLSRSDSTLRGHFPLETQTLRKVLEENGDGCVDGEILCPFFKEGGRFTFDHTHYVAYGNELVPASETEFAADATFGYSSSDLFAYTEEKTKGVYPASSCLEIPLSLIREMKLDEIEEILLSADHFRKIIVNAVDTCDVEIVSICIYRALAKGKRFILRTAAGLVKAMGNVSDQPLLVREQMRRDLVNGGVIVVGSHTEKTTRQLEKLKEIEEITFLELNSDLVLDPPAFEEEIRRVIACEEKLLSEGRTVCVSTCRKRLTLENDTPEEALSRSVRISDGLQRCVGELKQKPSFVVAKGGITSSDVGIKALKVKRTRVAGQIMPGVSVWITGEDCPFPQIPYVIFPGNVGDENTLAEAVRKLL